MTETEFNQRIDASFSAIEAALEAAQASAEWSADCETANGILEIAFDDGAKLILNRHAPTQELWLAAREGGFHYRLVEGRWRDTRGGAQLGERLAELVALRTGASIVFAL